MLASFLHLVRLEMLFGPIILGLGGLVRATLLEKKRLNASLALRHKVAVFEHRFERDHFFGVTTLDVLAAVLDDDS
jgi:hypothetical protein